jgi:hypothetical protein
MLIKTQQPISCFLLILGIISPEIEKVMPYLNKITIFGFFAYESPGGL